MLKQNRGEIENSMQRNQDQSESQAETILEILDRPIAFHRCFVTIPFEFKDKKTGRVVSGELGVHAALMLSQAFFWSNRTDDAEGWFYKSIKDWQSETGLTRFEQETARHRLCGTGFWVEKLRGVPATVNFRIDAKKLAAALGIGGEKSLAQFAEKSQSQSAKKQQTSLRKTSKLKIEKAANQFAENQQTIKETKITAKNTSKNTAAEQQSLDNPADDLPAAAANEAHLSRFSFADVEAYVIATKKHATNPGGLARFIWQTGEEDSRIDQWMIAQAEKREIEERLRQSQTQAESDFDWDEYADDLIARNDLSQLENEREGIEERGGPVLSWEHRVIAYLNNGTASAAA